MKKGLERAPHRSLFKAIGYTDKENVDKLFNSIEHISKMLTGLRKSLCN